VFDTSLKTVEDPPGEGVCWYDNEWGYANRTLDLEYLVDMPNRHSGPRERALEGDPQPMMNATRSPSRQTR
jgi:hypothetical protein